MIWSPNRFIKCYIYYCPFGTCPNSILVFVEKRLLWEPLNNSCPLWCPRSARRDPHIILCFQQINYSKWSTMEIPLIGESIFFVFLVGIFLCFCVSACACHCVCLSVWLDMWLCAACNLLQFQTRPVKCIFLIKQCDTPPPVSFARSGSHHSNPTQSRWVGKGFHGREESTDLMFAENIPILKINW